jgi:hypothetical protein
MAGDEFFLICFGFHLEGEGMGQGTGSASEEVGQCLACDTEGDADSWHATAAPARGDSLRKEMSPWAGVPPGLFKWIGLAAERKQAEEGFWAENTEINRKCFVNFWLLPWSFHSKDLKFK